MRLVWTERAALGLRDARAYVAQDDPGAAGALAQRIVDRTADLIVFPLLGRRGRIEQTYELVVPRTPYIIAYRVRSDRIEILAVLHGRRRWPRRL